MSPLAISLTDKDNSHDGVVNNILSVNDRIEWDSQFQELVKKLLVAQNRYIQLLEKELKKHKGIMAQHNIMCRCAYEWVAIRLNPLMPIKKANVFIWLVIAKTNDYMWRTFHNSNFSIISSIICNGVYYIYNLAYSKCIGSKYAYVYWIKVWSIYQLHLFIFFF